MIRLDTTLLLTFDKSEEYGKPRDAYIGPAPQELRKTNHREDTQH